MDLNIFTNNRVFPILQEDFHRSIERVVSIFDN